jgi:hypothetical protein
MVMVLKIKESTMMVVFFKDFNEAANYASGFIGTEYRATVNPCKNGSWMVTVEKL